ncbi:MULTISPECIES: HalOD1 output domain-containing protein [Haloarcula]|uniref:Halobacterial output domain-containing protein n=1 Tax=Haloarcula amylolytica JCM 13557 TaxID=1227452 RepID=M0L1D3_9EURY|nr:HalOD1 output domain-containing protein [Haloarcula amylolytica]EMA25810.1 hypothetical protein C442_00637 [Haloarcula amylolytica JCM 13557]
MKREVQPTESVSEAVVRAVSTVEDRHPRTLPSLYDVVNPEALNDLFRGDSGPDSRQRDLVSFQFSDSVVTVGADECIRIERSQTFAETS